MTCVLPDQSGELMIHVRDAFQTVPSLLQWMRPDTIEARRIRSIHKWGGSSAALVAHVGVLEMDWTVMVERLERIRNSIIHGGPITDAVVSSVIDFADELSFRVMEIACEAILDGRSLANAFDDHRAEAQELYHHMIHGRDVETALFGTSEGPPTIT